MSRLPATSTARKRFVQVAFPVIWFCTTRLPVVFLQPIAGMLACMPLPPLAEDVLNLMERPDLKPTHRTLLKLRAALITQTEMSFNDFLSLEEPRMKWRLRNTKRCRTA